MKAVIVDHYFDADYASLLRSRFPALQIVHAKRFADVTEELHDAEVLFALGHLYTEEIVARCARLRWIQALTTGTDAIERLKSLAPDVIVTNARGVHVPQMSEMAFCHMLSLVHRLPQMWQNQQAAQWQRWPQALLYGKTVAILGVGAISMGLARRCKAFDMRVLGISGTPRLVEHVDEVRPREQLAATLGESDIVVCMLPSNAENDGLADAAFFEAMKPSAFFINMSRGLIVDETALMSALEHGRIAGAALDAFITEPLPADSPLWHEPNLIVSPKHGGTSEIYVQQIGPILLHNVDAFLSGRDSDMRNRVR